MDLPGLGSSTKYSFFPVKECSRESIQLTSVVLSPLISVGESVLVTSVLLPSAANSPAIYKGGNKT